MPTLKRKTKLDDTSSATKSLRSVTALLKTKSLNSKRRSSTVLQQQLCSLPKPGQPKQKATKLHYAWLSMKQTKTLLAHLNFSCLYCCLKTTSRKLLKKCGREYENVNENVHAELRTFSANENVQCIFRQV